MTEPKTEGESVSKENDRKRTITDWRTFRAEKKKQRKEWKEKKLLKSVEKAEKAKEKSPDKVTKSKGSAKESKPAEKEDKKRQVPTVSIAVPGAILDNAQSPELRTLLAGQIARAASISCVDEVIVYDETGSSTLLEMDPSFSSDHGPQSNANLQMARILQYLECPQYLRKFFFPIHRDLKHAGLLPPLDSPHHLRESDISPFREGVVLEKPLKEGHGSFVNVGLRKEVQLGSQLETGLRVTVRMEEPEGQKKKQKGQAVDPTTPRNERGLYWGYNVRLAQSLGAVFAECPYEGGYDATVGTSDKGDSVDDLVVPTFRHMLIVFGGVKGLEYALDCDQNLTIDEPKYLFQHYLNVFPGQGSRTIRTEEAILLTMAALRPKIQSHITPLSR